MGMIQYLTDVDNLKVRMEKVEMSEKPAQEFSAVIEDFERRIKALEQWVASRPGRKPSHD